MIDVNCKNSSTGRIVYDLFQDVRRRGHEALLCYGRGVLVKEEGIYKFGLDWETYIHAGLSRLTGYNGCFSRLSTRRLIHVVEQFKPDVVHIHELHAYFVNIKPLIDYMKKKHIKVVWTFHCEYMYTGKCGHANSCANFEKKCGNCPELYAYPKSLFFDKTEHMLRIKKELLNNLDFRIICPSEWLRDRVRRSFLKEKRIDVIYNGVDTEIFRPTEGHIVKKQLQIPPTSKVVLSVGADILSERKGGSEAQRLARRFGSDVFFVLAGARTDRITRKGNVIILPTVSSTEHLAMLYTMADVFLLCSKKETFSMTCAEALCCGTRVVGYRCGAPETIFKRPYAVFVEQGDMDALEVETKRVLVEGWTLEDREKCAIDAQCKYGKDQMAEKYFDIYRGTAG